MEVVLDKLIKPIKKRVPDNYCKCCGGLIPKLKTIGWPIYDKRKYCGDTCRVLAGKKRQNALGEKLHNPIKLSDGTIMPIAGYIGSETEDGRLMADIYIGALKRVKKVNDDADIKLEDGKVSSVICTYKGVKISLDYVKAASDWLTANWLGKPGQRRDAVPEPELSRDEIEAQIVALEAEE